MAEDQTAPAMVKLVSGDGMEFLVEREAAMVSGTIKNMLSSPGVRFPFYIAAFLTHL